LVRLAQTSSRFSAQCRTLFAVKSRQHMKHGQRLPILRAFASSAQYVEKVPALGDSISEGTVVKWMKVDGDYVNVDDVLVVLETDKVSVDIRSKQAGKLVSRAAKETEIVKVGAELCTIDMSAAKSTSSSAAPASKASAPTAAAVAAPAAPKTAAAPTAPPAASTATTIASSKPAAAPVVPPRVTVPGSHVERRVPMTRMRSTIAKNMKNAQNTAAMLTTFQDCDMTALMAMREKHKDEFLKKHGVKLGFMSAFVKASVAALEAEPAVNASIDGNDIIYRDYCDVSVAVATPTGLVVPVLRNAEAMSFADIEKAIAALGEKARKNQITLEDMAGGTFTISNGGVYGSLMGTPIINAPQSAILGMHAIFKRPVAVVDEKGADKVEVRSMMYLALTYDHRIIDGRQAVTFLKTIKQSLEDPQRLLLHL